MIGYVNNKAWEDARYELRLVKGDTHFKEHVPIRFNDIPPEDVFADSERFRAWLGEHSIVPFIQIGCDSGDKKT